MALTSCSYLLLKTIKTEADLIIKNDRTPNLKKTNIACNTGIRTHCTNFTFLFIIKNNQNLIIKNDRTPNLVLSSSKTPNLKKPILLLTLVSSLIALLLPTNEAVKNPESGLKIAVWSHFCKILNRD